MLEVLGLQAGYGGSQVLSAVSLRVGEGEVATLLGRNGMGKTTTVRAVMGLNAPRGGTVHLSGTVEAGLVIWPEGRSAAWPPPLLAMLSGTAPAELMEGGPRLVLAPLLGLLAAEAGWQLSLCPNSDGAAASLLLAPATAE